MHRLILALSLLWAGCGAQRVEVRDPARVERLRLQITKARNAIDETRAAIAKARGAAYLPELYVRLAELLGEEARYHYQVAYEREQRSVKALHVPQVRFLKEQAIALYRQVLKRYPETALADRVLFNLGQEHRELGQYDDMRAALQRLVDEHPESPLRNDALLVLGDDQFDRSDLDAAAGHYARITKAPLSRVSGLGHYKLAWVKVNQGQCKKALDHFEQAIDASNAWLAAGGEAGSGESAELDVRREALVDLTYCYSRERKPETAVPYLRSKAYSRGAYVAALERLADRFSTMDQAQGAADVARELLRLGPDGPERLDDARLLHGAVRKSKAFGEVAADVELITRAVRRHVRRPDVPAEQRDRLLGEFEQYARDLATRAQEALTAGGPRAPAARQVADAYANWLDAFPDSEFRGEILENLADVLAGLGDPFEAGRRLQAAAALRPAEDPARQKLLYDAVVLLQKALEKEVGRAHLERVVARAGLRRAARELMVGTLSPEQARRVRFAIAQTYYDEGRYRPAIDRLTAVALEYPGTVEGDAAVHLVLDSYNTINDLLGLVSAGRRFLAGDSPVSPKVKSDIQPIVEAAEQKQLDELSLAAAGVDGGDPTQELERFAERYQGTDLGERALLNAFVAARAAGDSQALYRLADEIAAKYPKSEQLPGIFATLARTAAARLELDRAVTYFRRAADSDPAERVPLLVAEGRLRAELADDAGAQGAFELALRAAETPEARALAGGALARLLERGGQPATTMQALQPLAADGAPAVLARLGLAQVRSGQTDQAEATMQRVLDAGGADDGDRARAHYGQAEAFHAVFAGLDPGSDVEAVQEVVTLAEIAEASYLKAAREGDPVFGAAALGRLATLAQTTATKLRGVRLAGVAAAQAEALQKGLQQRAAQLEARSKEALGACAELAWTRQVFAAPVRACLGGTAPAQEPVAFDRLAPRSPAGNLPQLDALRQQVSKNPDDHAALTALGEGLLQAGDAHAARLAFARAVQVGGGPVEQNLLGIASWKAGDRTGALEAFARAAGGGLEAGRQNLADGLRQMGLAGAADEALKRIPAGRPGGALLSGGAG